MATSISQLQAGASSFKLVVAIEGCKYLLCQSHAAAALAAWTGTDWTEALPGLFVDGTIEQSITPWDAFASAKSIRVSVVDTDHTDVFGTFVHKRAAGAETTLTSTADRNDTTINVKATNNFTASGEIYIGTECIGYSSKGGTSFTVSQRGKYSPFGTHATGSGGTHFGNHHRVGTGSDRVQLEPVVTQLPRVWIGKRVGIWLHTWDAVTQTMNTKADAQLVYAGRIAAIDDDPSTMRTVLTLDPVHNEIKEGVIGKNMLVADVTEGIWIAAGRTFNFNDFKEGAANLNATQLDVVASGASGTNQIDEGYYSLEEVAGFISSWLAGEKNAGRIYGYYTMRSPVQMNNGPRTVMQWRIEDASDKTCGWGLHAPTEIIGFLGLRDCDVNNRGVVLSWGRGGQRTNTSTSSPGENAPYTSLVFAPSGPSHFGEVLSSVQTYVLDNLRGSFVDQYSRLPASVKATAVGSEQWGIFLLDEKALFIGSYDTGVITSAGLAPMRLNTDNDASSMTYIGRRADDPAGGPVTIRQIFMLEGPTSDLLADLFYGSGTSGYNHSTRDTLGYGLGLGLPGSILGYEFDRSLTNLPSADLPIMMVIDEPTKFEDLIASDLLIRFAFLRWKNEGLEFTTWKTPTTGLATLALTESNKAAPTGRKEDHRIATRESQADQRAIVKINYGRDFIVGRGERYSRSIQLEDQVAVDDGAGGRTISLKMRNCYSQWQNGGAGVERLTAEFMANMPMRSRSSRKITRSINQKYFEGYTVGDVATTNDNFARDPLTGARGITSRPAFITRHGYSLGDAVGDVDAEYLDLHRGELYAPAAQIDETANAGGFTGGYNSGTNTLRCKAGAYSHSLLLTTKRGNIPIDEPADASRFAAGDKCILAERDAGPSAVTAQVTILSVSGNDITLTAGLGSPPWDPAKRWTITFDKYSVVTATQQDYAYQGDDADLMVEDVATPSHLVAGEERWDYNANSGSEKGEFVPTIAYGDGRPQDVAHERALINTINAFIDRKSAHQTPFLLNNGTGGVTSTDLEWDVLRIIPIFLGTEHLSTTVSRTLTIAPFIRSQLGTAVTFRAALSSDFPSPPADGGIGSAAFWSSRYCGRFAVTDTWSTSSTTWSVGADKTLSLDTKDLFFGHVWLIIEGKGTQGACRGLSKCIEGVRVLL